MKTSIFHSKYFFILSGTLTLILIYLLISKLENNFFFPSLDKIISSIKDLIIKDKVILKLLKSMLSVILCIVLSLILSIFICFIRMYNHQSHEFLSPFVAFLKSSPLAIIIVYFLLLFGNENGPFLMSFMLIFPLVFESLISAMNETNKDIISELKITNVSKLKKFTKIILPLMFPNIVMSFMMSFGLGLKVIIMGEYMMMSKNSLGLLIYNAKTIIDVESLLGILFLCVFLTLIVELSAKKVFKILSHKII